MRAEQVLPDSINQTEIGGTTIRKGTVAAFLANARVWTDPNASEAAYAEAEADMVDALPALQLLGLFDVLEIRDHALREWVQMRQRQALQSQASTQSQANSKEPS
ncbi:hypothetical protein [Paraburkholderia bryophila]|uniref:Preprotein translocase subunit SecD n=1 Tax=Paraburkholderia bryophila TaxID=420952 RepID=A0A329BT71_9BURK|nr:hypothetical protein [Paraburkholderia bryophila]RAS25766.1 hypothetical protein BX591_11512 [Paraburkholderia bryophila]